MTAAQQTDMTPDSADPECQPPESRPYCRFIDFSPPTSHARDGRQPTGHPADIRLRNRVGAIEALYPDRRLSRSDIARRLGLTRASASDVVASLMADGFVAEEGAARGTGRPGKPGTMLRLNAGARQIIAIEIEPSARLRGVVTDMTGRVLVRRTLPAQEWQDVRRAALDLYRQLAERASAPLLGAGFAAPGIIHANRTITSAPNLKWEDIDLADDAERLLPVPTRVDNNANCAVLGERHFGDGSADMMAIRIGDGIGVGTMIDDRIVEGAQFTAGEIAHVVVDPGGKPCRCGKRGCLETKVSAPAIQARVAAGERMEDALADVGRLLGDVLAPTLAIIDVNDIVLYGSPVIDAPTFRHAVQDAINRRISSPFRKPVVVRRTQLDGDIDLLGEVVAVLRWSLPASQS